MGSKQVITDNSSADRISDLPSDIISRILDRTPIRDAVATSILSRDWRHKWRRIGNLIFDEKFADDVIIPRMEGHGERIHLEYSYIIDRILFLHIGPIQKFVLQITYSDLDPHTPALPFDLLSSWMLFISQKEVKELTIQTPYEIISLPSHLFHCDQLQHLKLHVDTLTIHPPRDFKGFCNLLGLDLFGFVDGAEISNLISKCPLLERLSLNVPSLSSHPLVIDAPRLRFLNVDMTLLMSGHFDHLDSDVLPTLMNVQSVTDISLKFYRRVMDFCYLISIFGSVPKVETVVLRPPQTLVDMPPDAPMSLPNTLHNHKSLTLLKIAFSSPQCIYFVLCILKSSPNLQMLNLQIRSSGSSDDEAAALHFFDMQAREPLTLNSLLTVKIEGLSGSRVETMFIKMILSCSPILKMMHLTGEEDTLNEAELLQCPRSSSRAQDMPPDAPMCLPTTLHNHKSLTLLHVDISSLECIYFVLCVLKSSPNLRTLNLEILPSDTSENEDEAEDAVHLLDMQIKGLFVSKIDVMLIKLILSFSPVLNTMYLTGKDTRDSWLGNDIINEAEFTLMAELLQCPRSSCQAQVIYSRYPGDSSIFDFSSL